MITREDFIREDTLLVRLHLRLKQEQAERLPNLRSSCDNDDDEKDDDACVRDELQKQHRAIKTMRPREPFERRSAKGKGGPIIRFY